MHSRSRCDRCQRLHELHEIVHVGSCIERACLINGIYDRSVYFYARSLGVCVCIFCLLDAERDYIERMPFEDMALYVNHRWLCSLSSATFQAKFSEKD